VYSYVQLAEATQGCSISPLLYLIYDEAMIRETTDNLQTGISGDRILNPISSVDE